MSLEPRWFGLSLRIMRRLVAAPLEQACEVGNTSLYINGIDPGFSGDTLVHSAVSLTTRVSSITVQEIFDYANFDDAEFTGAAWVLE